MKSKCLLFSCVLSIFLTGPVQADTVISNKDFSPENSLHFDFDDFTVGTAEYQDGATGCTVFHFPKGAQAAIDIRGGSVGTFFTQEKMQYGEAHIDAITLTGGGILGLEATAGVVSALYQKNLRDARFNKMPLVSGGVIFDFTPRPHSRIFPDKPLGQAALDAAKSNQFPIGAHGVGTSATFGKFFWDSYIPSGQGGAFSQIGKTKIAVFTVVNALGFIINAEGQVVRTTKKHQSVNHLQKEVHDKLLNNNTVGINDQPKLESGNTTLTVVVINEKLSARHLQQIGRQVHHALSQVIYPYSTILDGDVLYTVSTRTQDSGYEHMGSNIQTDLDPNIVHLGVVASDLAKKAVWSIIEDK
tara:strand:- start:78259 stop:79332 length:1074 start_codon:yes stop_codon:yes gene_type:complete